jgi:hypothetical protein
MDIEKEQLKLRLIEAQMQVLQYQHREVSANLQAAQAAAQPPQGLDCNSQVQPCANTN